MNESVRNRSDKEKKKNGVQLKTFQIQAKGNADMNSQSVSDMENLQICIFHTCK